MKDYIVKPVKTEENDFIWCVIENATEQIIKAFAFQDDANDYEKFLNKGGAFAGWTPTFFLREVVVDSGLTYNQKFEALFV